MDADDFVVGLVATADFNRQAEVKLNGQILEDMIRKAIRFENDKLNQEMRSAISDTFRPEWERLVAVKLIGGFPIEIKTQISLPNTYKERSRCPKVGTNTNLKLPLPLKIFHLSPPALTLI